MNESEALAPIETALELVRPVALELAPVELENYEATLAEKIKAKYPVIMIYGMYSHGKSTLINALLGGNQAKIGASPTTDKISSYLWKEGGCVLVDTPGIEAKDQHDNITKETLSARELVVFVVENSSIDLRLLWEKLVRLVEKGQKTCLIVNDFDNCMADPQKMERLKDAYRQKLQNQVRLSERNISNILEQVPLYFVNAKLACKATESRKESLLLQSNLPEIKEALIHLASSMSFEDTWNILKNKMLSLIACCRKQLAKKSNNRLLEASEGNLASIYLSRDKARMDIKNDLKKIILDRGKYLFYIFEKNTDEQSIKKNLKLLIDDLEKEISSSIQQHLSNTEIKISKICHDFDMLTMNILASTHLNAQDLANTSSFSESIRNIKWSNVLEGMEIKDSLKNSIQSLLEKCKEWFPSFFEGKDIAASKFLGTDKLGVLANILSIIWEIYSVHEAEKTAVEKNQRRLQAINDAVLKTQKELEYYIWDKLDNELTAMFEEILTPIEKQVKQLRSSHQKTAGQNGILDKAMNELHTGVEI